VAIVTGAVRGIGKAIALTFLREGAKVAIIDSDKERLEILRKEMGKENKDVIVIPCDITKSSDVNGMVDRVQKTFGRIDILVNNAGIIRRGTIETVTEEDWDRVIEVNLKGTFNCCKAVVEFMKRQGCRCGQHFRSGLPRYEEGGSGDIEEEGDGNSVKDLSGIRVQREEVILSSKNWESGVL
jgi:NAD(P)-dependent dehydrogenase (short-subunit alcohol dehydrogenase family)